MRAHSLIILLCSLLAAGQVLAAPLEPERRFRATADFAGKAPGKPARDVSGLACMPVMNGARRCLLINDEGSFAQFARIAENRIAPGATLPIIGDGPSSATLGRAPGEICRRPSRFAELDGEAIAYADRTFYVAGSHGCSRKRGEFRLSAFHLARIRVNAEGEPAGPVELTYRLGDMLRQAGEAGPYFGRAPMDEDGLNVEGIAVSGDTLWAGLRAPSLGGKAFLVGASLAALFAPGHAAATEAPHVVAIPAGRNRGVRDLAALPDGRLLALIGPAQEQSRPYGLLLVDPSRPGSAIDLGELPGRDDLKAESLTILSREGDALDVLIGYDGGRNGDFEEYRLKLPRSDG